MTTDRKTMMPLKDTVEEVRQQPSVVSAALRSNHLAIVELAQTILDRKLTRVHMVGAGDSMYAGLCVQQAFAAFAGLPLSVTQAYEYAVYGDARVGADTALFVISSSGRQSTTRDALARALDNENEALLVGVTDKPVDENPFYTQPGHVLVPGAVKLGWPTQTTTAVIAIFLDLAIALGRLNGTLTGDRADALETQLGEIPDLMDKVLADSAPLMAEAAQKFVEAQTIYFIGSGPGHGVAYIGGALMAEGPQRVGVPLYVEEFHHSLRINTVAVDMPVFLIAPKDPAYQRYLDTLQAIQNWGGHLVAVVDAADTGIAGSAPMTASIPTVPYEMSALLSVLPLHQFSIALTKARVAAGHQRPWL